MTLRQGCPLDSALRAFKRLSSGVRSLKVRAGILRTPKFDKREGSSYFSSRDEGTSLREVFDFGSPLGIIGKLVARCVLIGYTRRLLCERNAVLTEVAESERGWRRYLGRLEPMPNSGSICRAPTISHSQKIRASDNRGRKVKGRQRTSTR